MISQIAPDLLIQLCNYSAHFEMRPSRNLPTRSHPYSRTTHAFLIPLRVALTLSTLCAPPPPPRALWAGRDGRTAARAQVRRDRGEGEGAQLLLKSGAFRKWTIRPLSRSGALHKVSCLGTYTATLSLTLLMVICYC